MGKVCIKSVMGRSKHVFNGAAHRNSQGTKIKCEITAICSLPNVSFKNDWGIKKVSNFGGLTNKTYVGDI